MAFFDVLKKIFLIIFLSAELSAQTEIKNEFIDPEVQNFFETMYGYKKPGAVSSFRDVPISLVNKNSSIKNISSMMSKYESRSMPSSDMMPLHYLVKNAYTSGPISSCVIEPDSNFPVKVLKFSLVEIRTTNSDYNKVYSNVLLPSDFIFALEETVKSGKQEYKVIVGWLPYENIGSVIGSPLIKSVYLSKRNDLKAPLTDVNLVIKAPSDRDPALFAEAFQKQVSSIGFVPKEVKNLKVAPNARFYLIEISGGIPIDKTDQLLANPFVLKFN